MIGDFMGCGPLPVRDPSYRKGPFGFDKGQSFVGKLSVKSLASPCMIELD